MFKLNKDLSIYATRGDIVFFKVKALKNGERHTFEAGDVVRIKVFNKKGCHCVVLQKDFPVAENTQEVDVYLTSEETTIGGVISKPVDYWYEIELNPDTAPQTIVGYDDDGAKVFKLFPEGKDASGITEDDAEAIPQATLSVLVGNAVIAELSTGKYNGKAGDSAYEIAVRHGFDGTEEEWAESLLPPGSTGDIKNIKDDIADLKQQMADVLYEPIAINAFTNSVNSAELGSTVKKVSLSWGFNKEPVSAMVDGEAVGSGQFGSMMKTDYNITANNTFTLSATDERGATATKTTSINFYNRIRYGAAANYTELALSDGILSNTKGRTFTATAGEGQYIWYMLPKRLGTCAFKVGGFDGGFTLFKTEQLTNASGYTEEYYIYRSDNAALGETTVAVA